MYPLLSAHFARLIRDKYFRFGVGVTALAAVVTSFFSTRNAFSPFQIYFYGITAWIGISLAVYSAHLTGSEFQDGTLRNQIIAGWRRPLIFFSHYIVTLVTGILHTAVYFLFSFLSGILLQGTGILEEIDITAADILLILLALLGYSAVFSCVSILLAGKAKILLAQLLLSVLMILAGYVTVDSLTEPETTMANYAPPGGSPRLVYDYPNWRYLEGRKRTAYEWADALNPSSFILHCVMMARDYETEQSGAETTVFLNEHPLPFSAKIPAGTAVLSLCFLSCGVYCFGRKDLM